MNQSGAQSHPSRRSGTGGGQRIGMGRCGKGRGMGNVVREQGLEWEEKSESGRTESSSELLDKMFLRMEL